SDPTPRLPTLRHRSKITTMGQTLGLTTGGGPRRWERILFFPFRDRGGPFCGCHLETAWQIRILQHDVDGTAPPDVSVRCIGHLFRRPARGCPSSATSPFFFSGPLQRLPTSDVF